MRVLLTEMIDHPQDMAYSHQRIIVAEVMWDHIGWLALVRFCHSILLKI